MVKVTDCDIIVSKFELQSLYYVYFRLIPFKKIMNLLYPPNTVLTVQLLFFYKDGFGFE